MFIAPPSMKVLKQRLEDRGRETAEQIEERLEAANGNYLSRRSMTVYS